MGLLDGKGWKVQSCGGVSQFVQLRRGGCCRGPSGVGGQPPTLSQSSLSFMSC